MSLKQKIKDWTDEKCLESFLKFIPRVGMANELIQDKHGFVTHQVLHIQCGEKIVSSPPQQLEWPLEYVTLPPEDKKRLN